MNSQAAIKIGAAGLILYMLIAVVCFVTHDRWHMGLFLIGSLIWVVAIVVWSNV